MSWLTWEQILCKTTPRTSHSWNPPASTVEIAAGGGGEGVAPNMLGKRPGSRRQASPGASRAAPPPAPLAAHAVVLTLPVAVAGRYILVFRIRYAREAACLRPSSPQRRDVATRSRLARASQPPSGRGSRLPRTDACRWTAGGSTLKGPLLIASRSRMRTDARPL
eukprot:scaffold3410_cov398-Prasinococcus_capsulatus_cf.AAC.7